jgi:ribosome-binding ATPase YchF (GTP1/OBG family)
MKIAIIGLSNSGKTTVYNALTGLNIETTIYPTAVNEPNLGMVKVPDHRLDILTEIFNPKKTTPIMVQYVDCPSFIKGDAKHNRIVFDLLKDADSLVHVVRTFEDEMVMHPIGNIDPLRDVKTVEDEWIFGDFELVEKRLESIEFSKKKAMKIDESERMALHKCREILEQENPLRDGEFSANELLAFRHLQFMSDKPEVIAINIDEMDLNSNRAEEQIRQVLNYYGDRSTVKVLALSAKVEMDIAQMETDEAGEFLGDLGIDEPASDEVRAWQIKKGADALSAAGKIHTDIQRGFIKAEVVSYDDFVSLRSMAAAREKGLLRLEGKTYEVRDGDIIKFRFNV